MPAEEKPGGRSRARDLFRAQARGYEVRSEDDGPPMLVGELARFNEWTEIASRVEGHFMERIAPGAFTKTIMENRDRMRVLFQHGKDPMVGDKPLGPIRSLEVDGDAVRYRVELLDTSYNRDLQALLEADPPVLGSSFRFEVLREDRKRKPGRSQYNPRGLDERTIQEVRMSEFGPVTFPAYANTKAGLRSVTDRMLGVEEEERVDVEDLSCLAQMIACGTEYIAEQDESDDASNIPTMEQVLVLLAQLVPVEAAEEEPAEDEGDAEMASDEPRDAEEGDDALATAPPEEDSAARDYGHPIRLGRREPDPLYTGKKESQSWRL